MPHPLQKRSALPTEVPQSAHEVWFIDRAVGLVGRKRVIVNAAHTGLQSAMKK